MAKIPIPPFPIPVQTPCGPFEIPGPTINVDIPGFSFFPLPWPPKISFPLPNCGLLKRIGATEEPPEDSLPD